MRVWSEAETKPIVKIMKGIQCFYLENHLWPNSGVKTTTTTQDFNNTFTRQAEHITHVTITHVT